MNQSNFKKLALMGMLGGVIVSSQATVVATEETGTVMQGSLLAKCGSKCSGYQPRQSNDQRYTADASTDMQNKRLMSESELLSQLNDQGKAMYRNLNAEGKALALKLASQGCKGQNTCKGLNSCQTAENSCAGLGSCKGKTPGPFKDKNEAVKTAAKHMVEKRSQMNNDARPS